MGSRIGRELVGPRSGDVVEVVVVDWGRESFHLFMIGGNSWQLVCGNVGEIVWRGFVWWGRFIWSGMDGLHVGRGFIGWRGLIGSRMVR